MSESLVETHELTKRYGPLRALDRCSLRIKRGEIHGLLGPNGAGKTTLIRLLMGFLRPSSGRATIAGLDCYHQSVDVHRKVTYVPGEARLFRQLRAREVLRFFAEIRGQGDVSRSFQLAERLKLDTSPRVAFMSTGMRQKLALAITMSARAELMILDEPTTNLDPNVRGDVMRMVVEARDAGQTVLFSSHVLSETEETCDRITIVRAGKLVHTQVMTDLRRQHRIRARLIDCLPEIPASLRAEITLCQVDDNRLTVETPGELSPILGWLACLPIDEVTIEPIGLRAVYDRFHGPASHASGDERATPSGDEASRAAGDTGVVRSREAAD
jgi:ABC-2 type transport system ATP-binding protein